MFEIVGLLQMAVANRMNRVCTKKEIYEIKN